jgi:hypothetical protein
MFRFLLLAFFMGVVACSDQDRPPGIASLPDAGTKENPEGGLFDAGFRDGPPPADATGFCGNEFFRVTPEPPNLYFVLDRSGSMLSVAKQGSPMTKYAAIRQASVNMVLELGDRANFGAAVFPGNSIWSECSPGKEVFPTTPGDAPGSFDGGFGPITLSFASAINVQPRGGTPIATTLYALLPILSVLPGRTSVLLATDGGPNCSLQNACGSEDCTWNIEGAKLFGKECSEEYNCCDAELSGGPGKLACLDAQATAAGVAALRDAGIRTYVLGIPGSEFYVAFLEQLATLGGSARSGSPKYYRVDDMAMLGTTLTMIGQKALITCEFTLESTPPDPNFVNVYFDNQIVAYDDNDGWTWTSDTSLRMNGDACDMLERGEVSQVQVVAGCPTQQPR